MRRLDVAEKASGGNFSTNVLAHHVSPPLTAYDRLKTAEYLPMVNAAKAQVRLGKRSMGPTFTPCIFSHLGEISSTAINTIEVITRAYRDKLSKMYFEDDISHKNRTAEFRMRFKDALMIVNASGFGTTLAGAGVPRVNRVVASTFDHGGLPPCNWEVPVEAIMT